MSAMFLLPVCLTACSCEAVNLPVPENGSVNGSAAIRSQTVVLYGGAIYTMNPDQPVVESLAYDVNGRIIALGTLDDVVRQAGVDVKRISLNGHTALPGFQDVHQHPLEAGVNQNRCLLPEIGSHADFEAEILHCAEAQSGRPWFYAAGVSMPDLLDLDKRPVGFLDELIPDKPALILDNIGHGAWVNSVALKAVGYDRLEGNPQGGLIDRDAAGRLTGVVFENAQQSLRDAALPPNTVNKEENYQGLLQALPTLAQHGITTVSDAGGYWTRGHHEAWLRAEEEGVLTVRANNALYVYPDRPIEQQIRDIKSMKYSNNNGLVQFDQVKLYIDGILSQGTSALYTPYSVSPDVADVSLLGFEYFDPAELRRYTQELAVAGFNLHFHATGDRGVGIALDAIETAQKSQGGAEGHHRITHLYMVAPKDRPWFERLGVYADVQLSPSALTQEYKDCLTGILGEWAEELIPAASLLAAKAPMTLSSDWDADELSPFIKIQAALTRREEGLPNVETAVRLMTLEPAKLLGHAENTGSLEVGKFADIAVIDQNIFDISTSRIGKTRVVMTLLAGKPIYDPGTLFK